MDAPTDAAKCQRAGCHRDAREAGAGFLELQAKLAVEREVIEALALLFEGLSGRS
jgi:hypothetical protein